MNEAAIAKLSVLLDDLIRTAGERERNAGRYDGWEADYEREGREVRRIKQQILDHVDSIRTDPSLWYGES